jgi:cytochrome c oxidase subunit 4
MPVSDVEVRSDVTPATVGEVHPPELLPGQVRAHPSPRQYVLIAVVLCAITAVEIATSYTEGDIPRGVITALLLVFAAVKFFLVASWYMHLRTDRPLFRRFFMVGGLAAIMLYLIVLLSLHAFLNI